MSPTAFPFDFRSGTRLVEVRRADDATVANALFRKSFGHPVPDYPIHYLATLRRTGDLVGYVHMTPHGAVRLCGGLCVDEGAYRTMDAPARAALRSAGGIAALLMVGAIADHGDALATFAYTGQAQSRRLIERLGFQRVEPPLTFALWHAPLGESRRAELVGSVRSLGPF